MNKKKIFYFKRHDYSESEIVDAIVYRKPIALKALYYLIDRRLKQGLSYPDGDFKLEDVESSANKSNTKTNASINGAITNNNDHVPTVIGSGSSVAKQNSQLLAKRPSNLVSRNSSQKNVDFKFVYNNNNSNNRENEQPTSSGAPTVVTYRPESTLSSKSPSPDITSIKYTRGKSNYQDIISRKGTSNTSNSIDRTSGVGAANLVRAESKTERYFMPVNTAEEQYHNMIRNRSNVNAAQTTMTNGQIRSLPGSVYRGSPERSLPRSPDYTAPYQQQHNRATSRIGSSKLSVNSNDRETTYGDTGQKFKVPNYYATKRSMTSMDVDGTNNKSTTSAVLKSRQLPMGKAKIDLATQQSKLYSYLYYV